MTRQERLDIGEKILIGTFVGSIVVEVLLTLFAITFKPTWNTPLPWAIVVLGAVFVGFLLYLANWLYSGDRTAQSAAFGFAALQILLAVAVIVAMHASHRVADYLGPALMWLAVAKAVTYAVFAGLLAFPRPVQDFLGLRRGEALAEAPPAEAAAPVVAAPTAAPPGDTLPLTDGQAAAFGSLANWMQFAAGLLIAAGLLRFLVGLYEIEPVLNVKKWLPGVPAVLEGIVVVLLGILLFTPAAAVKRVRGGETNLLMKAFAALQQLYSYQLLVVAVAAVAVAVGIATSVAALFP